MDDEDISDLANLRNELANKNQKFAPNGNKITEYNQRLLLQKQNSNDEDYTFIFMNYKLYVLVDLFFANTYFYFAFCDKIKVSF